MSKKTAYSSVPERYSASRALREIIVAKASVASPIVQPIKPSAVNPKVKKSQRWDFVNKREKIGTIVWYSTGLLLAFAVLFLGLNPRLRDGELVWHPISIFMLAILLMMLAFVFLPQSLRNSRMVLLSITILVAIKMLSC